MIKTNVIYRIKNRTVILDGSVERRKRAAFDMIQDTEVAQTLRNLIYGNEDAFKVMKDATVFNYEKNKLALGIELPDLTSSISEEYFESVCFALFNSVSDINCISLRTNSGYTTSPCNAFPFAVLYVYVDSELRKVQLSAYSGDKFIASMLEKTKNSLYELIHRCLEKELKLFVGSTVRTFEVPGTDVESQERFIYVIDTLAADLNDTELLAQFQAMKTGL